MARHFMSAIALAATLPLLFCTAAKADPSVDDILSALSPPAGYSHRGVQGTSGLNGVTRGIRAVAPPATAAVRTGAIAASSRNVPSVDLMVVFASGSAALTPRAEGLLAKLGKALTDERLASYRFRIEGHTDTVGSPEKNKALAQARADKVASFLELRYGVAPERLEPVGLGENGLLVPTPDQTAEPRNRRVQVVNLGG